MEEYTEDGILGRTGEILRLAMLAQDDYPHGIVDLEEHTEDGRRGLPRSHRGTERKQVVGETLPPCFL